MDLNLNGGDFGVPCVSVIGDGFCYPCTMELVVKKKIKKLYNALFEVFYQSENLLLQVDGGGWSFRMKRILQVLSWWHKWKAHDGENSSIFSVQQSHPFQIKKELHVFLADFKGKSPDFLVIGSYTSLSFKVFKGHRLLAEIKHNFTLESFYKGKEKYNVTIYPEVDYAFIVALLVILDENDTP
ncbi:hypothetical protein MANES_10G006900v8 [Manihot esculenta]|uniref:Tubby C-terminal domain-containing protein n=1 Tax=Manihot esculenta TaxID=3983 RepID=A0A2C9V284_MANES|nr:hypothetical protein MANES_10G006900v8 [Manihot esculenta]